MPIGKIEIFDLGSHSWDAYCRRVKQFIALNAISDELHVATLVTHVGEACYELMCDLCAPDLPEDKTFDDLQEIVRLHLEPQRSEIAERHVFRRRTQRQGETVSEYLQSLKHLAKTCEFQNITTNPLEVCLRDQFVSGLISEDMRSRLFAEKNVDYKRAVELALALEAADRHAAVAASAGGAGVASGSGEGIHRVSMARVGAGPRGVAHRAPPPPPAAAGSRGPSAGAGRGSCSRCGRSGHAGARCRYKNYTCAFCNEKGHLKAVCSKYRNGGGEDDRDKGQFFMNDSDDSAVDFYNIHCECDDGPYYARLKVEQQFVNFEVDTGSKIAAISKDTYDKMFAHLTIVSKKLKLKSYTGNIIEPLGYIVVNVTYGLKTQKLELFIIKNGGPPLMGRTWIKLLNYDVTCCHNINEDKMDDVNALRHEFPEVFADGLGTFKTPMQLYLSDKTPVFVKARPLPLALRVPVERELERLQRDDVIYKVDRTDYGTPIVPIVKKNGDLRICGDYKVTINPLLKDFHYPLPRIDDIFATLSGGEQYSKLDLSHAYQQVLLTEESQPMTAITTHVGNFVYKRVPFGIKCIPENFEKLIEETLCGLASTVVFLDDICVTGKNKETHMRNLRAVLKRLNDAGLRVNWSKCEFFKDSVTYLGYRIDKHGLHTDNKKVEAIVTAPIPENVTQLKSFLGLVNFYAKFCKNMSDVLRPLYNLLKKDVKWIWCKNCDIAFNSIKKLLSNGPVLAHYDATLPLILSVDSSAYGLGAVLTHRFPDGSERPVSCASRTLNAAELHYSQLDKEALAIVFGVKKHHQYLYGRKFILRSDHRALSYIFGENKGIPQTAASRLQRYAVRLAAYNFKIEFIPSTKNCFADALSRLPLKTKPIESPEEKLDGSYFNFIEDKLPVTFQELKTETRKDTMLNKIIGYVKFGWPEKVGNDDEKIYFAKKDNLFLEHGCLVWGYRMVIPVSLRPHVLEELHSGHLGVVKMKQVARNYLWWERIDTDIERVCRECAPCAAQRAAPAPAPLHSWPWPDEPWTRLNVDFLGPYRGKYYLVLIDAHSKWLEVECVSGTSAAAVISCLRRIFCRLGLPKRIVSDNGPPFSSAEYSSYLEKNGIKRILVAPYHPSSNGAAENAVRLVKQVLKKATLENEDGEKALCRFLFAYRNTEHCTTQKEPSVALMGRRLRGRLDLLRPDTRELVRVRQAEAEERRGGTAREASVGEPVHVRDYTASHAKWRDGVVSARTGPVSYVVKTDDGRECRRHIDQIIMRYPRKSRHSLAGVGSGVGSPNDLEDSQSIADEDRDNEGDGWKTPLNLSARSDVESPRVCSPKGKNDAPTSAHGVEAASVEPPPDTTDVINGNKRRYRPRMYPPHGMTLRSREEKK